MITMLIRTVVIYFLLFIVIRIMGKRQIGELQTSEFIITILLSEIASAPITTPNLPFLHCVLSVLTLLLLELSVSFALLRVNPLKRLFYGSPSVIIRKGRIDIREMKRNRMEIEELMAELRQAGYSDLGDVYYAILEDNGRLAFIDNDRTMRTHAWDKWPRIRRNLVQFAFHLLRRNLVSRDQAQEFLVQYVQHAQWPPDLAKRELAKIWQWTDRRLATERPPT